MKTTMKTLAVLFVPLLLTGASRAQQGPPTPVLVREVRMEEVQQKRLVTGEVRATRRAVIATREEGLVSELLVREGDRVEQGAVLARLDATRLELEVSILTAQEDLARSVLVERKAAAAQATRDLDVLVGLSERGAVNPKELADARTEVEVADARVSQANLELSVLTARRAFLLRRLEDMRPKAPFAGFVVKRMTETGEWVSAGGPLLELISAEELEAWLDVPQAYYRPLVASQEALWIEPEGSERLEAAAWRSIPALDSSSRTFPLVVTLPADDGLAAGMALRAEVPTGERRRHLTVPRDGILRGDAGFFLYVAMPGSEGNAHTAQHVPVDVLFYTGDRAAVTAARLSAGDLVVVEGNERLFPTAPVLPRPSPGADAQAPKIDSGEAR